MSSNSAVKVVRHKECSKIADFIHMKNSMADQYYSIYRDSNVDMLKILMKCEKLENEDLFIQGIIKKR